MANRALFILTVSLLGGCGKFFNDSTVELWVEPKIIRAELAHELSTDEEHKVRFDHYMLENLDIHGNDRFAAFFGGRDSSSVARWVADGVKFVARGSRSNDVAENFGMALFLDGIAKGSFDRVEWTSGRWMTPSNGNNGLILLHRYSREGNTTRAGLWPHERRHGDCENPPKKDDLNSLIQKQKIDKAVSVPLEIRRCGHWHIVCPEKHALKGIAACDDTRDGSYAYGLEWTRAVRDTCKNCDESVKDVSTGLVIEYESRILAD